MFAVHTTAPSYANDGRQWHAKLLESSNYLDGFGRVTSGERTRNTSETQVELPLYISLILPAHNKREDLELTLAGFTQQTYASSDFEVIVVDDGSTDGTEEMVRSIQSSYSLVYLKQCNAGRSAARNAGIRQARGEIIIFNDAEAIPDPAFIERHASHHHASEAQVVIGAKFDLLSRWHSDLPTVYLDILEAASSSSNTYVQELIAQAREAGRAVFLTREIVEHDFEEVRPWVFRRAPHNNDRLLNLYNRRLDGFAVPWILFVTVNASVRKSELERAGLFDQAFCGWGMEDIELGYRLQKAGARFVYDDNAANYHQMHPYDRSVRRRELVRNYELFCRKHPDLEVFLYCRRNELGLDTYSKVISEHRRMVRSGYEYLLADYVDSCRVRAEQFILSSQS